MKYWIIMGDTKYYYPKEIRDKILAEFPKGKMESGEDEDD